MRCTNTRDDDRSRAGHGVPGAARQANAPGPWRAARTAAALALAALVGGCLPQAGAAGGDSLAAEAALLSRIEAAVGDAACSSTAQCRTLAIGAKACGGPARWLAWSTVGGPPPLVPEPARQASLSAWSAELATLQHRRFEASGMMSTCSIVPDPGAACRAGRCSLNTGGAV